jgi:ABC-type amino acid transport substrate-binding protein
MAVHRMNSRRRLLILSRETDMIIRSARSFTAFAASAALAAVLGTSNPAAAEDDLVSKIEARGELRVCHAEDNPWTYRDPATGKWLGFTRDLAADLAAELEVELVDVDSTWKTIITSVKNGECDLGGGGLFATVTRAKAILFTIPFAFAHSTAIVSNDSGYNSYTDLDQPGKLVIGKAGTATLEFARRFFKQAEVKAFVSDTDAILLAEIANGRADAYWSTTTKGDKLLIENPQFNARLIGDEPEDYVAVAWAVNLGEYHFRELVNIWLTRYIESGKSAALWEQWFGTTYVRGDWR